MPTFETTIHLDAPPDRVWRVLTDFASFPQWNPMMVAVSGRPEVGAALKLKFVLRPGRRPRPVGARVLVCDAERELRWGGGVRGLVWVEHWVRLAPDGDGTAVEHGERFDGLLAGIGVRLFGLTLAPYEAMNAALKARVEAG